MRTLLAAILVAALIVTGVAIVVPIIARPMIVAAVQSASPFGDRQLDIEVESNVFGLLTGTVDRIHVRGADLTRGNVTVGALDLRLTDVSTSGHAFAKAEGTLAMIQVPTDETSALTIDNVTLEGASTDLSAVATLDLAAALHLIRSSFAEAGVDVSDIELGAGTVAFQAFGARVEVPVGVEDGAIVVVDPFGTGSLEIVRPGENDGWRFDGVVVAPSGMTIDASLDVERVLASG